MGNELKYLCEYNGQTGAQASAPLKMVSDREAKEQFPHLVVSYLETKLDCPPFEWLTSKSIMTRGFKKHAEQHNISFRPKITIVRNLGMEKAILANPAGPIIRRRITIAIRPIGAPKTLKKVSDVPFGARGRKRRTINVAYIGIQPNPDGRNLIAASVQPTPGRRTYARASSTPLATPTTTDNQQPTVESAIDLNVSAVPAQSVTLENSFDSLMGSLKYSDDDSDIDNDNGNDEE